MNHYSEKIKKIKKYFHKHEVFMEIFLENHEDSFLYFRIDYFKKMYHLYWFDLDLVEISNIEKGMGMEFIPEETIVAIKELLSKVSLKQTEFGDKSSYNKVTFYVNTKIQNQNDYKIIFYKYIPKQLSYLSKIFVEIFHHLPKKLENYLYELNADVCGQKQEYEYYSTITFDLFEEELSNLFDKQIMVRGEEYYNEKRVDFLEKIEGKYYAIVSGTQVYSVIIEYDEENKRMRTFCSCPCNFHCKHIYAVIKSIRKKTFHPFYKIIYRNPKLNLLENVTEYSYILCIGIFETYFLILHPSNQIIRIPILDEDGKCNFDILVDDDYNSMRKAIKRLDPSYV